MRLANAHGRLTLVPAAVAGIVDGGRVEGFDVETSSLGRFGSDPQAVYPVWDQFSAWARNAELSDGMVTVRADDLGPVAPRPAQIFAIGLNYAEHAAESNQPVSSVPLTFTKFRTCLAGPIGRCAAPRRERRLGGGAGRGHRSDRDPG